MITPNHPTRFAGTTVFASLSLLAVLALSACGASQRPVQRAQNTGVHQQHHHVPTIAEEQVHGRRDPF